MRAFSVRFPAVRRFYFTFVFLFFYANLAAATSIWQCQDLLKDRTSKSSSLSAESAKSWTAEEAFSQYRKSLFTVNPQDWREFSNLSEAQLFAKKFNLTLTKELESHPTAKLQIYNSVFVELWKIPPVLMDIVIHLGGTMTISKDNIVNNPVHAHLAGKVVPKWESGETYDVCTGLACKLKSTVAVAIDSESNVKILDSGSVNVVLHEFAHILDSALAAFFGEEPSRRREFMDLHAKSVWRSTYEGKNPEEGWAESFAKYYHSSASRSVLHKTQQTMHYFWRNFLDLSVLFDRGAYRGIEHAHRAVLSAENAALRINATSGSLLTARDLEKFEKRSISTETIRILQSASSKKMRLPLLVYSGSEVFFAKNFLTYGSILQIKLPNERVELLNWENIDFIGWPKEIQRPDLPLSLESGRSAYMSKAIDIFGYGTPATVEFFRNSGSHYTLVTPYEWTWENYLKYGQPLFVMLKSNEVVFGHSRTKVDESRPTFELRIDALDSRGGHQEKVIPTSEIVGVFAFSRPQESRTKSDQLLKQVSKLRYPFNLGIVEWQDTKEDFTHDGRYGSLSLGSGLIYLVEFQRGLRGPVEIGIADVITVSGTATDSFRRKQILKFRDAIFSIDPNDPEILIHSIYVGDKD